ncbi:hypothetical protein ES703_42432 [subsurface metagenome]
MVDQDQGVIDHNTPQTDHPEHGDKTKGFTMESKSENDPHNPEGNSAHHHNGLGQGVKEENEEKIDSHHGKNKSFLKVNHRFLGFFGFASDNEAQTRPIPIQVKVVQDSLGCLQGSSLTLGDVGENSNRPLPIVVVVIGRPGTGLEVGYFF